MRKIVTFSILIVLLFSLNQLSFATSESEGNIHTRVSYIDLAVQYNDGGDQYSDNVTIVELSTTVEIWNTGTEPKEVGYYWFASYCDYYIDVILNITGEVQIYEGQPVWQTLCDLGEKYYDPGLSMETAMIKMVFDTPNLVDLPFGDYIISAPTRYGKAYTTILNSNDGILNYTVESVPLNWGELNSENILPTTDDCTEFKCRTEENENLIETNSATISLPVSTLSIVLTLITIFCAKKILMGNL